MMTAMIKRCIGELASGYTLFFVYGGKDGFGSLALQIFMFSACDSRYHGTIDLYTVRTASSQRLYSTESIR